MALQSVTFRAEKEDMRILKELAAARKISPSEVIRRSIRKEIARRRKTTDSSPIRQP